MRIIYFKGAMGYEIEFGDESRIVTVKYAGAVSLTERLNAVKDAGDFVTIGERHSD